MDRNGRVRVFQYDEQNRLIADAWYADAADADAAQNAQNTLHYQCDSAGRIVAEWDDASSLAFVCSDAGLIASTTQTSG